MACRPATPAPSTSTRAGVSVPPAVIIRGNIWGSRPAAMITASYPAIVAIDDSTSIDWARVMRGTKSREKADTPTSARRWARSGFQSGSSTPTNTASSAKPVMAASASVWLSAVLSVSTPAPAPALALALALAPACPVVSHGLRTETTRSAPAASPASTTVAPASR